MQTIKERLPSIARILLGLAFTVFGLNGFLGFLPQPPPPAGAAGAFLGGLAASGYLFPLLKGTELVAGLLLLTNRFVPLGLTLLAPVLVNIAAFHLFLQPQGSGMIAVLAALELYLAWSYRHAFAPILLARTRAKASTSVSQSRETVELAA
jgi:hypothetical protein